MQVVDAGVDPALAELLCCPLDRARLDPVGGGFTCVLCGEHYPVRDGIVALLPHDALDAQDRREQASRDDESSWYDTMFEGYTNAVEVPTVVARLGRPNGIVLDHGAGTGRITERLAIMGVPVIAVDYSAASLRKLLARADGRRVLAVQADVRALPIRDGVISGAVSCEVYEHVRGRSERSRVLCELARVLKPGAPLAISTFNYNLTFRAWSLLGNRGARAGEGDLSYVRQTRREFRDELSDAFDVRKLVGIRNIPARTLAQLVRRAGFRRSGDRLLRWMTRRGWRYDVALERTPFSGMTGFFWLATAVPRVQPRSRISGAGVS